MGLECSGYLVEKGEEPIFISTEDLEISTDSIPGYEVAGKGNLTVALDLTITQELQNEGDAREFVNRIQNIRKDSGFELTDRIVVKIRGNADLMPSLLSFKDYICREILADSLEFSADLTSETSIEVNENILEISVHKKTTDYGN